MANGKIRFGKQSGGELALVFPDGVDNTEVVVPESGILAKTSDINTAGVELKTIATGTATFSATTNNINLTGIGIGVEIGDVIQISGAIDAKNNSEFTVEVITDANNIIVNQAHANKGTIKNVAAQIGDAGVTVKLLSKSYNAPIGLGQAWVDVTTIRQRNNTIYSNNIKRNMAIFTQLSGANTTSNITISGLVNYAAVAVGYHIPVSSIIPIDGTYSILSGDNNSIWKFYELR